MAEPMTDRELWIQVRHGLLYIVRAIEQRWELQPEKAKKPEQSTIAASNKT